MNNWVGLLPRLKTLILIHGWIQFSYISRLKNHSSVLKNIPFSCKMFDSFFRTKSNLIWMLDLKISSSLISIVYCCLRSCIFKVMFVWEKHKCLSNDETVYVWDNDTRLTYLVKRRGWIQVTMTRQFTDLIMVWTSSIYNRVWTIFTRYIKIEKKNLLDVLQS